MTLSSQILKFLGENPSSTARAISHALNAPHSSVATYLSKMSQSNTVSRSKAKPFKYSLLDPAAPEVLPIAPVTRVSLIRPETKLADEQAILSALQRGVANDRETLLDLLVWAPLRLDQALARLHAAHLVKTVHRSYVLIPRAP